MAENNEIWFDLSDLGDAPLLDARQAMVNFELVRKRLGQGPFGEVLPRILSALREAADPDMALNHLEGFLASLEPPSLFTEAISDRPEILRHLIVLFGASRFLSLFAASTARESLNRLAEPTYLARPMEKIRLAEDLALRLEGVNGDDDLFRRLRLFRKQEMLRICLRDLLGHAELSETVGELSNLAEVALQAAYEHADAELRKRHGRPITTQEDGTAVQAGFAVIGMGKLGGRELNFSSDVDLMYVYSADGETEGAPGNGAAPNRVTNHQYFVKLAEKVSAAIGKNTADGFVFRVDLRLRPEGQRGPLAQSLGGYEIYYESWGQTWERSALIKARTVAGDSAVGKEFLARITPFVYRKYLDFGAIVEIREMKQKINREVQQKGNTNRDVKLGYGGIREIEFLVQALQLIYGGRDRSLRERNSLKAMHVLVGKGLLTYQEVSYLSKAYVFLRTVEHRIQMLNDLQSQTLPAGGAELRALARRTGYRETGREAESLLHDHAMHTRRVRSIYDVLLGQASEGEDVAEERPEIVSLLDSETGERTAIPILERFGFRDAARSFRNISLLREGEAFVHQTPRARRVFHDMFPKLIEEIGRSPDPDMALHHFESFLASQGSWDAFQALVQHDPRLPAELVSVFGNSEFFSRMLIRTPAILQDLLEAGREEGLGSTRSFALGLSAAMADTGAIADRLDSLRRFKHREELRIGMADLTGSIPLDAVSRSLSRLAEACLGEALLLAAEETSRRFGGDSSAGGLAIIGAGKLGGRELIYGSDLDILFVFDESRAGQPTGGLTAYERSSKIAEKTIAYLSTMTREGAAYRVDTRLRPTGRKGPLVQSIEAFRVYFGGPAETWERQSLVNARLVAGDKALGKELGALEDLLYRDEEPQELAKAVRSMRKRMEDELGREDAGQYNIKHGPGGMVDIEFLTQFLRLRYGGKQRRVRVPGTVNALRALRRERILSAGDGRMLTSSYLFLRRLESRLRIVANQSTSFLLRDPGKLRTLAKRLGYGDDAGAELLAKYEDVRKDVRKAWERLVVP